MSRFWPHTDHAEEQPYAGLILYTHVLYRGYQSGALIGTISSLARPYLFNKAQPRDLLRATGLGGAIGTAVFTVMMPFYMSGQEGIQWKDRSWRLLENKGQLETDDWTVTGTLAGAVYAATIQKPAGVVAVRQTLGASALRIAGGAGVGNLVGLAGYMIWRHGINRSKFD